MSDLDQYTLLGALFVLGALIGTGAVVAPLFIAPRWRGEQADKTYECGVDTIGSAWIRFSVAYYLFALIFVAFEVDILYLFPVAVVYNSGDFVWRDLVEVTMFVGILGLAIVFAWRKGVFKWT